MPKITAEDQHINEEQNSMSPSQESQNQNKTASVTDQLKNFFTFDYILTLSKDCHQFRFRSPYYGTHNCAAMLNEAGISCAVTIPNVSYLDAKLEINCSLEEALEAFKIHKINENKILATSGQSPKESIKASEFKENSSNRSLHLDSNMLAVGSSPRRFQNMRILLKRRIFYKSALNYYKILLNLSSIIQIKRPPVQKNYFLNCNGLHKPFILVENQYINFFATKKSTATVEEIIDESEESAKPLSMESKHLQSSHHIKP
jgi:hypothetical protein